MDKRWKHLSVKPASIPGLPIKAVVDYDVDRLDVEAWQHVKLTSTNCLIGLNSSHARILLFKKLWGKVYWHEILRAVVSPLPFTRWKPCWKKRFEMNSRFLWFWKYICLVKMCWNEPVVQQEWNTPSHSEQVRETSSRRWYYVLRHGRVDRCRFFSAHFDCSSLLRYSKRPLRKRGRFFIHMKE